MPLLLQIFTDFLAESYMGGIVAVQTYNTEYCNEKNDLQTQGVNSSKHHQLHGNNPSQPVKKIRIYQENMGLTLKELLVVPLKVSTYVRNSNSMHGGVPPPRCVVLPLGVS